MSLRSPLARVLNHGAAHDGASHWVVERVTGLALVPLCAWLLIALLGLPNADYATVSGWIAAGWNPVLLALTLGLASWHSWLGVQVAVEDYVADKSLRASMLLLSTALHALLAASGLYALLHIALRGAA